MSLLSSLCLTATPPVSHAFRCTGDGGSPLVCSSNGIWYVVGLVAWGIGCGQANVPGVYVNVGTYLPWIQTTLAL
ncbi:hypothetical protein ACLKA6_003860 [Drosophila palustris]